MTTRGYNEDTGIYITRYYAKKAALGSEVVVHVCGGYTIMAPQDYRVWQKQK